ncbi:hypothetical protein MPTK1_6g03760 [Marchantia polymorpha subsp. ruderalis]|uniref:P-type ATPase N-terminal domain-containing protein n=1 Tax=Marchantia polymorpha subsp. ruderalis TaxID=1480154 RepID=A0AAF6BN87_MARPO|nr:hypothetical protein Mp_6g03760 [Marchantia polymorpha subsp. ruderalis]
MARGSRSRGKKRMRFSKLYTYTACVRPGGGTTDEFPAGGGPEFSIVVFCNTPEKHFQQPAYKYKSNYVSTTKYNLITFLPKALFEQFRRVANLYFLLAGAISLTPVAPYSAASLIAPLLFVVGVSMIKEAVEDSRRFTQDQEINNRKIKVHSGQGKFKARAWKKLRVGDVVEVGKD